MFPQVDPIPLPAPIWLFKLLEIVTISLHFVAVQLLIGGLLVSVVWSLLGRRKGNPLLTHSAGVVVTRLPILMVYVINFGVPPLLFAQVLYGRAIYTSSILIGAAWISVIWLLMLVYCLLYVMAGRTKQGTFWGWIGLLACAVIGLIALIYSSNMTLMIRPQVWSEMYRSDPLGVRLNTSDPTVWPRWLFMIAGGVCTSGVGLALLARLKSWGDETARFLRDWGVRQLAVGVVVQVVCGAWVVLAQPSEVRAALGSHGFYLCCMILWLVLATATVAAAVVSRARQPAAWLWTVVLSGLVFLGVLTTAVIRGGIRDLTLLSHGMDIWDRQVHSNWLVTGAFLLLFVLGLAVVAWLVTVVARAKRVEERYV